jgi:hypothetical protein
VSLPWKPGPYQEDNIVVAALLGIAMAKLAVRIEAIILYIKSYSIRWKVNADCIT